MMEKAMVETKATAVWNSQLKKGWEDLSQQGTSCQKGKHLDYHTYAHGDATPYQHGVQHADGPAQVVPVEEIPDGGGQGHAGHQPDDGTG